MQSDYFTRREFITLLGGGAAAAWPPAGWAQQPSERMRHIGVLMNGTADDPAGQARIAAFHQGLQERGWTLGQNARIEVRWAHSIPAAVAVMRQNSSRFSKRWTKNAIA